MGSECSPWLPPPAMGRIHHILCQCSKCIHIETNFMRLKLFILKEKHFFPPNTKPLETPTEHFILYYFLSLCCVLCTVCCVLCAVYCVLCTVYCVLCTVYCGLCTVYCVLCTVCCVLCTACVLCLGDGVPVRSGWVQRSWSATTRGPGPG